MTNEIKNQKVVLKQALKVLDQMETVEDLFKPIDPIYSKLMTERLTKEYVSVMEKLFTDIITLAPKTPIKVTINDSIEVS